MGGTLKKTLFRALQEGKPNGRRFLEVPSGKGLKESEKIKLGVNSYRREVPKALDSLPGSSKKNLKKSGEGLPRQEAR